MRTHVVVAGLLGMVILIGTCPAGDWDETVYEKVANRRYRVRTEMAVRPSKDGVTVAFLPFPVSSPVQGIETVEHSPGDLVEIPGSPGEKLLAVTVNPDAGETVVFNEYIADLWSYRVDFGAISAVHPYTTDSGLYQQYTKSEPPYIDTANDRAIAAAETLAAEAEDSLDYARRAYFHVIETIGFNGAEYLVPRPLETILKNKRGSDFHAGNYFITLLRIHGIPARNVFALSVTGTEQRWHEFFLEQYGWIPVRIDLQNRRIVEPACLFGMAIMPPHWRNRQPHCIILGHTVQAEIARPDGTPGIPKFATAHTILVTGRSGKQVVLIEEIED